MTKTFVYICRACKAEYPEDSPELMQRLKKPGELPLYSCPCGGIVDLVPKKELDTPPKNKL